MVPKIDADALYNRKALQDLFGPLGVDADTFVARTKPKKVFRQFYLGSDLLDALRKAPALDELRGLPPPKNRGNRKGKPKIGGLFDPDEVGL